MSPGNTTAEMLRALEALVPLVRERTAETDRRCALPNEVVQQLLHHELFRLWIPRRYDGLELGLEAALEIHEAAARIDGSLGWAVMIGAGGGIFAAYLEEASAREIFGSAAAVIAGSGAPDGRAERTQGGYRVSGRWRYASGATYATTFTANCVVTSDGEPLHDSAGLPLVRAMAFARRDVEVLESWNATGMRGTASHDFRVNDVFVPERRSFSVFLDPPRETGPLYRLPFQVVTELPIVAVALGIARHALDAFAELAAVKRLPSAGSVLVEDPSARSAFARAHAEWQLAKAGLSALAERAWRSAADGTGLSAGARAEITAACALAIANLRAAIDGLAAAAGMSAIDAHSDLGRTWQDLLALGAHFAVSPRQLEAAGSTLLRSDPSRRA